MDNQAARPSRPGDEAALREIWKVAFGDTDEFIDRFMAEVYEPGMASVAEKDGEVVSAIYLFEDTELVFPGDSAVPAPYCYTLGTLVSARGAGLGAAVSEHIMQKATAYAPLVTLLPAQGSLYGWYSRTFGLEPISRARECEYRSDDLSKPPRGHRLHRLDAASYGKLRELLLKGKCHARYSARLLNWYNNYIREDKGGLYLIDLDGKVGCAACELGGRRLTVKELLLPDASPEEAAALLNNKFRKDRVQVRTPAFFPGEGSVRDFAVARLTEGFSLPDPDEIWWGLAFD